jgi:4'-phosphopantetheinyl transferase
MNTFCPNVWTLDTSAISERELDTAMAVLSREEIEQAFRFDLKTDHVGYTLAHCLARIALAQAAGCEPAHLRFGKGLYGRPHVTAPLAAKRFSFNLSHTEGLVGIAISRYPVGLDVESIVREINLLEVAEDVLTEAEIRSLLSLDPVEMRRRFFQLWTLKEAYLKAIGSGFLGEPKSFSFEESGNGLSFHPPENGTGEWTFLSQFCGKTHCLALCYASANNTAQFHDGRELLLGSPR